MKIHHIGYITGNIENSSKKFELLGYEQELTYKDDVQKCLICLLINKADNTIVELVQPNADNKTLSKLLERRGASPYHICFEVDDVQKKYEELSHVEGWIPIFPPVEAIAFSGRKITYFINAEIGFIEFLNKY